MKIAVAAMGDNLEAPCDPRFGRCAYFLIVDSETMDFTVIPNNAVSQGSGAGIAAAQLVSDAGADAVISGNFGPNAHQTLGAGGIQTYGGATGTVREAVEALQSGRLQVLGGPNAAAKAGVGGQVQGSGAGLGRGGGGGRGAGGGGRGGAGVWQTQPSSASPQMNMPPEMEMPSMWGPQSEPSSQRQLQMLRAQAQMIQAQLDWIKDQIKGLENNGQ